MHSPVGPSLPALVCLLLSSLFPEWLLSFSWSVVVASFGMRLLGLRPLEFWRGLSPPRGFLERDVGRFEGSHGVVGFHCLLVYLAGLELGNALLCELLVQGAVGLRTTGQADANLVPQAGLIIVAQARLHMRIGLA